MEPNDLETMPNLKSRKGKSVASRVSSWTPKSQIDGEATADTYWNYAQRNSHSIPHCRNERRQEYTIMEPTTSRYSSSSSYSQQNHRVSPNTTHPKFSQIQNSDQGFRCDQTSARSIRNKLLTNNVAVVRKDQYKEELEDEDDYKYVEDELLLNSADENLEDEAGEEELSVPAEEYQDETYDFHEKDYEEQEIDDEVDVNEADAFPRLRLMQKSVQKEHQLRTQQLRAVEQQQEARRVQHQQRMQKLQQGRAMSRYYHAGVRNDQITHDTSYGDVPNVISEEEVNASPATSRKSSRGSSSARTPTYQPTWNQLRRSSDRGKLVLRPSSPPPEKNHRRSCIVRSDLESLMEPQLLETHLKKCCICGGSVNVAASGKNEFCRKGNCRLQNNNGGFSVKGPIGDDGESEELNVCGLCATRHHMEDLRTACEASAVPPFYLSKPRRSRYPRSPIYETTEEEGQMIDEMSNVYSSVPQRHSREVPRERTRHSVQSTRASTRKTSRY